ncbi:microtubule-associated tumor suppressor 1 homolog A isoform X1 [Osmerus mordax]|uniref:microtubule-associated tumor suppressor 1 homolog A isoform X1 n=1 Tax=Osmerus mordax TaxID=8014 RepID=UPI00351022F1
MLWSPKLSLSNIHVRLTAKGLLRNLQLLSGCRKNTMVFHAVDKNRPKANPRNQPPAQPKPTPAPPAPSHGHPDLVLMAGRTRGPAESYQAQWEKHKQLRGLLASSDCRFEAVVVVLQQALAQRDEAMKRRKELSQEMIALKGELVSSSHTCDRLKQEKEEALSTMEEVLLKVQEQHGSQLAQLEDRLQTFYQAEWDKVHLTYQQEADKYKALMEQQMGELRATHDDLRQMLENRHSEQLQSVQKQHEDSLEEMRTTHKQELQTLERTLKEAEATLSGQIQELTAENGTLSQRLKAEEDRRRELADKNQKDSHTLYLEQELESLKVVLDIKIKQLHQQEKKLMQMDKLMEKSVKLDECLQKVQQENEDLRARMDKHSALSRQLSTEQAVLQESLQKESKVNKRLSMENEELLWKLHNGDLSSPRKMSPTSPALSIQSPRSSAIFSSPPVSPR